MHQAKIFFHLVQSGQLALEKAEADIRMSAACREFLLRHCDANEAGQIEAVFRAREQTWEAFMLLCAGEDLEEKPNAYAEDLA